MTTSIERYGTSHGDVELSLSIIKQYFCPLATDQEAMLFLRLCQYQGLNPFLKEAYLIKYSKDRPATMVVGKETFTQRAEMHPQYDGFQAGIVIYKDGSLIEREGSLKGGNELLMGGWAEVHRKDRKVPVKAVVSMDEYSTSQSTWTKMPCTMIRKVAIVQAMREAFPSSFAGLYDSSEMKVDIPDDGVKAAAEAEPLPPTVDATPAPEVPSTGTTAPGNGIPRSRPSKAGPQRTKELPHFCVEHEVYYELTTSPMTGQSRWCHKVRDIKRQTWTWCVEPEPMPLTTEKPDAPDLVTQEVEDGED